jgi:pentatricopeptide repeat protein
VYIGFERLLDAHRVFDGLVKNVISWNVMIGGYAQCNNAKDAMEVFLQMRQENVEADDNTYFRIMKACVNPSALKWGKEVHAYIKHEGLESDVRVGIALLQMYAKCGCIKEEKQIFDNLTNVDVVSSNWMIIVYMESGSIHDARLIFYRMEERIHSYVCKKWQY